MFLLLIKHAFSSCARSFHTSAVVFDLPNHRLYPNIDWDKVEAGSYAVVDPVNPGSILYLSEQDYIVMIRVSMTSNKTMKVLAVPGDTPVRPNSTSPPASQDPSQNSPSSPKGKKESYAHPVMDVLSRSGLKSGTRARGRLQHMFDSFFTKFVSIPKGGAAMGTSMISLTCGNARELFTTWYDHVSWWTRGKTTSTVAAAERNSFAHGMVSLLRHNGISNLIQVMKICLFVINTYLGGTRLPNTQSLGRRVRLINGLPAILPLYARNGIRTGNRHFIHTWTSVFFAYKALKDNWKVPNLFWEGTLITAPHPIYKDVVEFDQFRSWCQTLWRELKVLGVKAPDFTIKNFFFTTKAGPNCKYAILGASLDAYAWTKVPRNLPLEWLRATGQKELARKYREIGKMEAIQRDIEESARASGVKLFMSAFGMERAYFTGRIVLGRLHLLYEAAGKVRVIAITDYWTNNVLKPLHDWMFSILRKLPQDATFDQNGKTQQFASRGYKTIYSLDLKQATDTIPLALYRAMFCWVIPNNILCLWLDLLVDRDWLVPSEVAKAYPEWIPEDQQVPGAGEPRIRYSTGQPMGALTSWASMALLHHAIVLFSAYNVGVIKPHMKITSFIDYLILGDDVVIANREVAMEYQRIMGLLGVTIGLNKSFISDKGMFNFANQSFVGPTNCSPISLREEIGIQSLPARAELAMRMVRLGWTNAHANGWLTPVLKLFLSPSWMKTVQRDLNKGITHPVVSWILQVLLVPGSTRFANLQVLPRVSIQTYLAAMLRKALIWNKPIKSLHALVSERRGEPLILSILTKWVGRIYKEFLDARQRLKSVPRWVESTTGVGLEYVLQRIFAEQSQARLDRWAARYRYPLKEVEVTIRLGCANLRILEIGAGRNLEEITALAAEAEKELPRIPDFIDLDIETLVGGPGDASSSTEKSNNRVVDRFLRTSYCLGLVDQLGDPATPGVVFSQDTMTKIVVGHPDLTEVNNQGK